MKPVIEICGLVPCALEYMVYVDFVIVPEGRTSFLQLVDIFKDCYNSLVIMF